MIKLPSSLPWFPIVDGEDLVVENIKASCFGGAYDSGDNGQTESGILNDGSNPSLMGVALPIRSIESATSNSPLAFPGEHIPWGTIVMVWKSADDPETALACQLIDNGPNTSEFPDRAIDLNPNVVLYFDPDADPKTVANDWLSDGFSYRIIGGAKYTT